MTRAKVRPFMLSPTPQLSHSPPLRSQAMDRCHRIGQTKPVLVLRLVTASSADGKMLKRAESKMQLEQLVLKKGTFKEVDKAAASKASSGFSFEELEALLESGAHMDDRAQVREGRRGEREETEDAVAQWTSRPVPLLSSRTVPCHAHSAVRGHVHVPSHPRSPSPPPRRSRGRSQTRILSACWIARTSSPRLPPRTRRWGQGGKW